MSEEEKIKECKVLKEGYERYASRKLEYIKSLTLGTFESDNFAHVMFGFVKLGSEYYNECEIDYDKSGILMEIGNLTTKLIESNAKNEIQSKTEAILSNIQKQLESILREDHKKRFETNRKALVKEIKKLEES